MTRKTSRLAVVGAEDEPLGFADELDGVKRLAWAIGAAADGIPGQEPFANRSTRMFWATAT
jgi:hypothetical protein